MGPRAPVLLLLSTLAGAAACATDTCSLEGPAVVVDLEFPEGPWTLAVDVTVWEGTPQPGAWAPGAPSFGNSPRYAKCLNPPTCSRWWARIEEPGPVGVAADWWGISDDESMCGPTDRAEAEVRVRPRQCVRVPLTLHGGGEIDHCVDYFDY